MHILGFLIDAGRQILWWGVLGTFALTMIVTSAAVARRALARL